MRDLLACEVPIQLAPMGGVSVRPALPLAVAGAGAHAVYPALGQPPETLGPVLDALAAATRAFGVNFIVPLLDPGSVELGSSARRTSTSSSRTPTRRWSSASTGAARCVAGRSRPRRRRARRRTRAATR